MVQHSVYDAILTGRPYSFYAPDRTVRRFDGRTANVLTALTPTQPVAGAELLSKALPVHIQQRKCLLTAHTAGECQCTKSLRDSVLRRQVICGRGNQDRDRR
jgi:hypothetical protein